MHGVAVLEVEGVDAVPGAKGWGRCAVSDVTGGKGAKEWGEGREKRIERQPQEGVSLEGEAARAVRVMG